MRNIQRDARWQFRRIKKKINNSTKSMQKRKKNPTGYGLQSQQRSQAGSIIFQFCTNCSIGVCIHFLILFFTVTLSCYFKTENNDTNVFTVLISF